MKLPVLDKKTIRRFERLLGREDVLSAPPSLRAYSYDASVSQEHPLLVVFPACPEEISQVFRLAAELRLPVTPRGAGTNLSGGSISTPGGIVMALSRMDRLISLDIEDGVAVVEPGMTNLHLQGLLAPHGQFFAPDPASQKVSTLGGNVAENSGGPHCLKYGVTTNHILGLEVVLPDGQVALFGGAAPVISGLDLTGLFVGSEGSFGVATKIWAKTTPLPDTLRTFLTAFASIEAATQTVSAIIAAGIVPATLEMIDKTILGAIEASVPAGYPADAEAVLIIELDGSAQEVERLAPLVEEACRVHGATEIRSAESEAERARLWAGRKGAFGAISRVSPNYSLADGTVPRSKLPDALRKVREISTKYGLTVGNVFHAGDGNLHPLFLFDAREEGKLEKAAQANEEVLEACIALGGTITGEHGVGLEKIESMPKVFSLETIEVMRRVKEVFDPRGLCNPDKVLPRVSPSIASRVLHPVASKASVSSSQLESVVCEVSGKENTRQLAENKVTVSPASAQEISEILKRVYGRGVSVEVRSSNLLPVDGREQRPSPPKLIISTGRLNRIVEHDAENLTATIQAGVPLSEIQTVLGKRGQWLPFGPWWAGSLGGMVAENAVGPERLAYGSPRDALLGMEVVIADGTTVRCGGKTVKNVAGYDLGKLFCGSRGVLGIITEATFQVKPAPEESRAFCIEAVRWQDAVGLVKTIRRTRLRPSSLSFSMQVNAGNKGSLFAVLEGFREHVANQADDFVQLTKQTGMRYEACSATVQTRANEKDFGVMLSSVPSALPRLFEIIDGESRDSDVFLETDLGCGVAWLSWRESLGVGRLQALALKNGGQLYARRVPQAIASSLLDAVQSTSAYALMSRLKTKLDPVGVFPTLRRLWIGAEA